MPTPGLCLLRTPSTAQSLMFPPSASSYPTPTLPLLYALLATTRSSPKPQRELALPKVSVPHEIGRERELRALREAKAHAALDSRLSNRRQRT